MELSHKPIVGSEGRSAGHRLDIVAGLTASAVVIPKAMAYATVAGLPVAVGLYTALFPMAIYALLGSSRVLSVSSTTTIGILTYTQLALVAPDGNEALVITATATLGALVGVILLLARALRLGFVANFISMPVLTGFKAGIGLVIVVDQVPKLFGVHIEKAGFFRDVFAIGMKSPELSLPTLAVAAGSLMALIAFEHRWPHSKAPLVVVGAAIAASWYWGLEDLGVYTVGFIPKGLPELTLPELSLVSQLFPGALGIALMSFTESIAAGRAFAKETDPELAPNRELVAVGAANMVGALFGAMPAGGGTSQTLVVRAAGGHSQKASLATATVAGATMLLLAPLLSFMPHATLAAVVIVYSVGLIDPSEFRAMLRIRPMEFRWAVIAALGVLIFGTLQGILVAITVSTLALARQSIQMRVAIIGKKLGADVIRPLSPEHPDDETFDGLLILRPVGRLYFLNVEEVLAQVQSLIAEKTPEVVVLDLSRISDIEYSALKSLETFVMRESEGSPTTWLAGMNPEVLEMVRNAGLDRQVGENRMLINTRAAIAKFQALNAAPNNTERNP
jgi:SulP family sulfate permease